MHLILLLFLFVVGGVYGIRISYLDFLEIFYYVTFRFYLKGCSLHLKSAFENIQLIYLIHYGTCTATREHCPAMAHRPKGSLSDALENQDLEWAAENKTGPGT